ncbi:MAG: enolase C-terminal domain-like protein [Planctomycetaceae bacterium]
MKITRITTHQVEIPLKPSRRMISALGQHSVSRYVLVRIETDSGIEGAGEATVMARWSGETAWGASAVIDHVFTPLLIGCDPSDIPAIDQVMDQAAACNWFAKSAIEMACWDIRGKSEGKPVYELLGGAVRPLAITCRFSMGAYPIDRARKRAAELVEEGFETIKVKVGTEIDEDVARVTAVRETMGGERDLVIDANAGWDAATAIEAMRRMKDLDVGLFEQPTTKGDFHALAEVRREISCPVMADDIVFDLPDVIECIRHEACDVISLYPGKNGGIRKAWEMAELAGQHGVACSIGSNLEFDIAAAAMCHLVVACPNMQVETYPGDILGPDYHEARVATNPISVNGPVIETPTGPGLGVEVDWNEVARLAPASD